MQPISFTPTEQDLLAAYRVQISSGFKSKKMVRGYAGGAIVLAMFGWMISSDSAPLVTLVTAIGAALFWCFVLTLMVGLQWLLLPARVRRVYAQQRSLHDLVTVEWDGDGILFRSHRGDTRFPWGDFVRVAENRDAILLYQSDLLFNFVPKRVLSPEQSAQVMEHGKAAKEP